ncbi:unnamed protein product [Absidia cylindrospora]
MNKLTSDLQRSSSPANLLNTTQDTANCLKGVVACLDIRTEDGDDVSQNFEMALKSMGAKTRKTFADSVTHLIYKWIAINVKKALHIKCKLSICYGLPIAKAKESDSLKINTSLIAQRIWCWLVQSGENLWNLEE